MYFNNVGKQLAEIIPYKDAEKFMKRLNGILSPLLTTERGIMYWPALKQAVQGKSGQILVQ